MAGRPLAAILHAVAAESNGLGAMGARLQDALSPIVAAADVHALQSLDQLTQSLTGLAGIMAGLGERVPASLRVDVGGITSGVTLGRLAAMLEGRTMAEVDRDELFE